MYLCTMKAVVDDKIPYIQGSIEKIADTVVYLPGNEIGAEDVRDADILIVRTRTRCDRNLLEGSRVQIIATATIGYDHIDTEYLQEAGIKWTNCPGCNATSVAQYIHSCLLLLKRERGFQLNQLTIGIVGVGHVGSAVQKAIAPLGVRILLNDPPRALKEKGESEIKFCNMQQIQDEADIITFHTPLIQTGDFPTYHLADETFFERLKKQPVLINSGRGEVVDNTALLKAIEKKQVSEAIIDTWENEPHLNLSLLNKVYIGTPHIAGYSADGKANATRMSLEAICNHFGIEAEFHIEAPALPSTFIPDSDAEELSLQLYNPHHDSNRLKQHPENFEKLRGDYPLRREHL